MPCTSPLEGWWSKQRNENGKRIVVFNVKDALVDRPVSLPCGNCISCRLKKSKDWAIRCMHEADCHEDNAFITLTFSPEYQAKRENPFTVDHRDFQLFMKRLRKRFKDKKIKYYMCGEYGDNNGRPHYHALIFGMDFPDKELWRIDKVTKSRLYRSAILEELWPYGFSTIGEVTFDSAAYVARYVTKKITGKQAEEVNPETGLRHYEVYDPNSGEIFDVKPEYCKMSLKPAIGKEWYEKHGKYVRDHDFVIAKGKKNIPPKYYDRLFEHSYPNDYLTVKKRRLQAMAKSVKDDDSRLLQKDAYMKAKFDKLKRNHDK